MRLTLRRVEELRVLEMKSVLCLPVSQVEKEALRSIPSSMTNYCSGIYTLGVVLKWPVTAEVTLDGKSTGDIIKLPWFTEEGHQ